MSAAKDTKGGFTLVEVLAAFFMLAMFLTATFAGLASAVGAWRTASQKRSALIIAQNRLDALGVTEPIPEAPSRGTDGASFMWIIEANATASGNGPYHGTWITVTVKPASGGNGNAPSLVRLRTFRLARELHHG